MVQILDHSVVNPDIFLFDWDGVLVDTSSVIKKAYTRTFEVLGQSFPVEWDDLHQLPSVSLRDFFPKTFGSSAKKAEQVFYDYINTHHLPFLETMAGAKELLEWIFSISMPMAVISNKRGDVLRKEIEHLGFEKFFFGVLGSKDCPEDKPSALPVHQVLSEIKISNPYKKTWFVGDSVTDMECAYRAGVIPILIHNHRLKSDLKNPFPPKVYADSCLDLKNFLIQYMKEAD